MFKRFLFIFCAFSVGTSTAHAGRLPRDPGSDWDAPLGLFEGIVTIDVAKRLNFERFGDRPLFQTRPQMRSYSFNPASRHLYNQERSAALGVLKKYRLGKTPMIYSHGLPKPFNLLRVTGQRYATRGLRTLLQVGGVYFMIDSGLRILRGLAGRKSGLSAVSDTLFKEPYGIVPRFERKSGSDYSAPSVL